MRMEDCKHENFKCIANVMRLLKNDGDAEPSAFVAEIGITCLDCEKSFEFLGVPMGYHPGNTRVSVDGLTLNAAIKPKGAVLDQSGMHGYSITAPTI